MALINCKECQHQVSSKASSCPQCGAPIMEKEEVEGAGTRLFTTQETSKDLKVLVVWAYCIMLLGMLMTAVTPLWLTAHDHRWQLSDLSYGLCVILLGVVWQVINKIRIWWHHG